ncbi:MAG: branched-chain amino acid ABC transporter permease [Actinomycetota bacterium]|nr:branched-chain amino acid ABC transporter permease [Actinomycetota bacterium]
MTGWISFLLTAATITTIFSILTIGLNLHLGLTGLVNLGHVAFFAFGAFMTGLIMLPQPDEAIGHLQDTYLFGFNAPWPLALLIAVVSTGAFAYLVGYPALRAGLNEAYLGITTFAVAEMLLLTLSAEDRLVNGFNGLRGLDRPFANGVDVVVGIEWYPLFFLALSLAMMGGCWWFAVRLSEAPFGRVLRAIREDPIIPESLGHGTLSYRLKAFVIGAAMAGLAGSLFAVFLRSVAPQNFLPAQTFIVLAAVIVGGAGRIAGSVLGTVVVVGLIQQGTRFLPDIFEPAVMASLRQIVIGLVFILVLRYRPEGILPERIRTFEDRVRPKTATVETS